MTRMPKEPVHCSAIDENWLDVVDKLIEKGADPNLCNSEKFSPLMLASKRGYTKIVERLLMEKSVRLKINSVGDFRFSALDYAVDENNKDCIVLLLKSGASLWRDWALKGEENVVPVDCKD